MVTAYPKMEITDFNFISMKDQYFLGIAARTTKANTYIQFLGSESDLISYVDVSKMGFGPPAVEIIFSFSDRELVPYLSEKAVFSVSIGKDLTTQEQSTFSIVSSNLNQSVEGKWMARIVGIYSSLPYLKVPKKKIHSNVSSEIAKQLLQENFGKSVKMNTVVRTKDNMYWLQSNESDYAFLHKLWLHSHLQDSVWMAAIDFDGTPRMTDLRKQAATSPKITLTTGSTTGSNTYAILDSFDASDNSAAYNSFGGYTKTRPIYDLDNARKITAQKKETVILSESNSFNRSAAVSQEASHTLQTSNVHENFYSAPINNRSYLASIKSCQLDVTVEGEFVPVKLLDYVMVKDSQSGQAQQDYSGIYLVGKIAHQIANKKIYTHITLFREAWNKLAPASVSDEILETETKVENYQNKIDSINTLMTPDVYYSAMQGYTKLEQNLYDMQNKIRDAVTDTEAYKMYRNLDKKYKGLKAYLNDVLMVSTSILNNIPLIESVQDKLNSITIETPLDDVQSTIRSYLSLQKYVSKLNTDVNGRITSNGVYNGYQDVQSKFNQMTRKIQQLQELKVIGELDEYIDT